MSKFRFDLRTQPEKNSKSDKLPQAIIIPAEIMIRRTPNPTKDNDVQLSIRASKCKARANTRNVTRLQSNTNNHQIQKKTAMSKIEFGQMEIKTIQQSPREKCTRPKPIITQQNSKIAILLLYRRRINKSNAATIRRE